MFHNLFDQIEVRRLKVDGTNFTKAAGTTDVLTSDVVDMNGYEGVGFLVAYGAIVTGATGSHKVAQSGNSSGTPDDFTDLAGSKITPLDTQDNLVFLTEIYRPTKRYVELITTRATQNSTIDAVFALLYRAQREPVTQGATVGALEQFASPDEGTA